ncbi:hypothetical protein J6590_058873 [Homalodisca vitripennis]|nr:hypothetical protein J6590_058873 [Homalodisca vitripennis]
MLLRRNNHILPYLVFKETEVDREAGKVYDGLKVLDTTVYWGEGETQKGGVASDPVNDDGRAWITRLDLKGRAVASRFSLRLKRHFAAVTTL